MATAAQLLLDGALAIYRIGEATPEHADALMHVVFGGDLASELLRNELLGRPELDPFREPVDLLPDFNMNELCLMDVLEALRDLVGGGPGGARPLPGAVITAVVPNVGCPDDQIEIQGTGFGGIRGSKVGVWFFTEHSGYDLADDPAPRDWSDERILVEVPERAGHGCVAVMETIAGTGPAPVVFAATLAGCMGVGIQGDGFSVQAQKPLVIRPPCAQGGPSWFAGGRPSIIRFAIPSELAPGQATTLSWEVTGADRVELWPVSVDGMPHEMAALTGSAVASSGELTVALLGDFGWRAAWELRAWNACRHLSPP